jgi:polyhydroxyalkanoate synthesis regulator phasin
MMQRWWKAALALVLVLVLGGAAVGVVAAQTADDPTPPPAGEGAKLELRERFFNRLAENLGITPEELKAAVQQTALDLVDEAVAAGRLTEEQAQRIRERIESGNVPFFGKPRPHPRPCRGLHVVRAVAEFLDVEPGEVISGLHQGQSLAQIAEANGSSAEELKGFLLSKVEERVNAAVEAGRITEEQAAAILERAEEGIERLINHEGPIPCRPHRPGFDGPPPPEPEGMP